MKKRLKIALFLLIAVLAPFLLANEILRLTSFQQTAAAKFLRRDWDLIFSLRPGASGKFRFELSTLWPWKGKTTSWELKVNSQGLRAPYEIGPKRPGTYRIICLGDSITFGLDLDDEYTYPSQLEKLLRGFARPGATIEVINAGVYAYTSRQGLAYLDQRLLKFEPDLVILGFGFNDAQSKFIGGWRPDREYLRGSVQGGWKKIYASPFNAGLLVFSRQPLVVTVRGISRLVKMIRMMAMIKRINQPGVVVKKPKDEFETTRREAFFAESRVPPEDYRKNLEQFVWLSQRHNFHILFYITDRTPLLYRKIVYTVAIANKFPVVDFSTRLWQYRLDDLLKDPECAALLKDYREKLGDDFLRQNPMFAVSSDGVHPNAAANLIIAREIAAVIAADLSAKPF